MCATVKHLPAWFPGAKFKRDAAKWRKLVDEMYFRPYYEVKAAVVSQNLPETLRLDTTVMHYRKQERPSHASQLPCCQRKPEM